LTFGISNPSTIFPKSYIYSVAALNLKINSPHKFLVYKNTL
jgi:hypothetical protein